MASFISILKRKQTSNLLIRNQGSTIVFLHALKVRDMSQSGVARNMSCGVQYNIFDLKALLLLYFLKKILRTPFYLLHISFGLGGANAPLHLPWLRY